MNAANLPNLPLARYRLTFATLDPVRLPDYAGSAWRRMGDLAQQLAQRSWARAGWAAGGAGIFWRGARANACCSEVIAPAGCPSSP